MQEYLAVAPVASVIFAITIIVSLLAFYNETVYNHFMLTPSNVYHGRNIYTVITSGFIHKDWMHLFFNMFSYYFFAFRLEYYLGHWQFGLLYMGSLILSDLPTVMKHKNDYWYRSLGASGAISAVIFSSILFEPRNSIYLYGVLAIPAWLFGVLYLAYCYWASKQSHDTINHDAHLFGAISGIVITFILNHQILGIFLGQLRG
ncbi:membrane associated rhomboid family serine protease [Mucilaginibacter yixingensis]|uniref:Membrane associated rhomboid family serine protease n=1 Tax=Mucilaginibacter yixingensis TaxID=1295612 RepID=A0A2T5JEK4_9SPHI|nr:rhomboid family intramembrane serine protease [Mucilaginibacter yixingensis]PTR00872.1 membrane associated rhomboid family serine protease [Mucilaginibacter yixingensis]